MLKKSNKGETMNKKQLTIAGIIISCLTIMAFYLVSSIKQNTINSQAHFLVLLVLILNIAALTLVIKKIKTEKQGFKFDDELNKQISLRAGYYAWITAIWSAILVMWVNIYMDKFNLGSIKLEMLVAVVVIASGLMFFGIYFYLNKRGIKQ